MKFLLPLLLCLCSCGYSQDNTNPYCGPGNVPLYQATDGPAALPQRCMFTQISSTPSSNYPTYVGPASPAPSLPMVLSAARPGDMIVVDSGSETDIVGILSLPNGDCVNQKWITIKSASPLLPDEYTRVSPSFAGNFPKIVLQAQNSTIAGGSCLRLIGIEVTRKSGGIVYNLFSSLGHDVIFDRMYIHGTPSDETVRGIELSNSTNVAVINSYFSDFHCLAAAGSCTDAQAIHGGTSSVADGNYKIVNNYLEAGTENIMFGGGGGYGPTPDILIAYNTLAKPMSWDPMDPSYAPVMGKDGKPHPWVVKNLFELKNATRVMAEGNVLRDTWGGFTQVGAMMLLTPKNQGGANGISLCPACAVTDVTFRLNHLSYGGQALQLACIASSTGGWPAACGNWSIHDNLFDHLQYPNCYQCTAFANEIASGSATVPLRNVSVVHDAFLLDGVWLSQPSDPAATAAKAILELGAPPTGLSGMHFDFNVFDAGNNGIYSTGGGVGNCFSGGMSIAPLIANCWPGGSFTGNAITQSLPLAKTRLPWPPGNDGVGAGPDQAGIAAATSRAH